MTAGRRMGLRKSSRRDRNRSCNRKSRKTSYHDLVGSVCGRINKMITHTRLRTQETSSATGLNSFP